MSPRTAMEDMDLGTLLLGAKVLNTQLRASDKRAILQLEG
jgi:hypothetical protein